LLIHVKRKSLFLLLRIAFYLRLTVSQNFQQVQDCILQIQRRRQEILHSSSIESQLAFFHIGRVLLDF
jgi:hypothetical protein